MLEEQIHHLLLKYIEPKDVPIVTNRLKVILQRCLPEGVDIEAKWESKPEDGIHVRFTGNKVRDGEQLMFLGHFAEDQGWNKYREEVLKLLKLENTVLK